MSEKPTNSEETKPTRKPLINIEEVKSLVAEIPAIARNHPSVKLLVSFVGKVIGAVNTLDSKFWEEGNRHTLRIQELEKRVASLEATSAKTGSETKE